MTSTATHYEILNLPASLLNDPAIPSQSLRNAYRRALLLHHPDKSQTLKSASAYSVDQISTAYAILGDAKSKALYDKKLKLQKGWVGLKAEEEFRTGVEVVDLDDLIEDEENSVWYRGCRCGDERGYEIREQDLEEAAEMGEISVGCNGCSLWMRVLFGVVEESKEAGQPQAKDSG
jgi:diphthamide biosynthesis protein 4